MQQNGHHREEKNLSHRLRVANFGIDAAIQGVFFLRAHGFFSCVTQADQH